MSLALIFSFTAVVRSPVDHSVSTFFLRQFNERNQPFLVLNSWYTPWEFEADTAFSFWKGTENKHKDNRPHPSEPAAWKT